LLEDRPLRENVAARGRQLAEDRYDWDTLGKRLEKILLTVVEDPQRPSYPACPLPSGILAT